MQHRRNKFFAGRGWAAVGLLLVTSVCLAAQPGMPRAMQRLGVATGWVTDGAQLLVTHDDGRHWRDVTPDEVAGHLGKVFFLDADQAWVVARDPTRPALLAVLQSVAGGRSWTRLPDIRLNDRLATAQVVSMQFADVSHGWLMLQLPSSANFSFGRLLTTTDGGMTWQVLPRPPAAGNVRFTSARHGTLTATSGTSGTWVTDDGGLSWRHAVRSRASADHSFAHDALARHLSRDEAVVQEEEITTAGAWALVQGGTCRVYKAHCSEHTRLLAVDGGDHVTDITPEAFRGRFTTDSVGHATILGFDACAAPSTTVMNAWWHPSPWGWANIYIGGTNRSCSQANLNSHWVSAIFAQGWKLVPTWVGKQAPGSVCHTCSHISSNTSTAYQQGINEANAATAAANALGLTPPTIIYYDMEHYDPSNSAAANAFISGWVKRLHDKGNQAGVYSSPYNLTYYTGIAHVPDAVWIASWNGSQSVFGINGLPDSKWDNHERLHQYRGGHNSTYNGYTLNIDTNSSDGPVATPGGCAVTAPILAKYNDMGGASGVLGACTTNTNPTADGGKYNHFEHGSIYWRSDLDAHELHGAISELWNAMQWELGPLGYPLTDQRPTADGVGAYNDFEHGSIYWSPSTGAHEVMGAIYDAWDDLHWEQGVLGYPITGQEPAADGGQYNDFEGGSIYWSSSTGAHEIMGAIYATWEDLQWEQGVLGYPVTGEQTTDDGVGRYNAFEHGVIYWTSSTGAHAVHGKILDAWDSLGREKGCLGYPTSNEHTDGNHQRNDFQHGKITWSSAQGAVVTCNDRIFRNGFEN